GALRGAHAASFPQAEAAVPRARPRAARESESTSAARPAQRPRVEASTVRTERTEARPGVCSPAFTALFEVRAMNPATQGSEGGRDDQARRVVRPDEVGFSPDRRPCR